MTYSRTGLMAGVWTALALLLAGPAPAQAQAQAQAIDDYLTQRWFYTEVVIFLRSEVMDFAFDEDLVRFDGAAFPQAMQTFRVAEGEIGHGYDLDPATRAFLDVPVLDLLAPLGRDDAFDRTPTDTGTADSGAAGRPPPDIEPILDPDPLLDLLAAAAAYEGELAEQSYRWLDPATFTLTAEANRLSRVGGMRVLLHGRWLQPVPARQTPEPLLLQVGPRYGETYGLEGTVDVTLGRFLHFNVNLIYREPLIGGAPLDRAQPPAGDGAVTRAVPTLEDLSPAGFMHLRESRRVRSGELHYLDHPKLGVLVRIEPLVPPADLGNL
jgi:hypothetical protein